MMRYVKILLCAGIAAGLFLAQPVFAQKSNQDTVVDIQQFLQGQVPGGGSFVFGMVKEIGEDYLVVTVPFLGTDGETMEEFLLFGKRMEMVGSVKRIKDVRPGQQVRAVYRMSQGNKIIEELQAFIPGQKLWAERFQSKK